MGLLRAGTVEKTTSLAKFPSGPGARCPRRGDRCYFLKGHKFAGFADATSRGRDGKISSRSTHPRAPRSSKHGQIFISVVGRRSRRHREYRFFIREPSPSVEVTTNLAKLPSSPGARCPCRGGRSVILRGRPMACPGGAMGRSRRDLHIHGCAA